MMIPQIARRLIKEYGKNASVLLDPFMGSGTALFEAKLHDNFKEVYGVDINPLALLIAKVKTTPIDDKILGQEYYNIMNQSINDKISKSQIETRENRLLSKAETILYNLQNFLNILLAEYYEKTDANDNPTQRKLLKNSASSSSADKDKVRINSPKM